MASKVNKMQSMTLPQGVVYSAWMESQGISRTEQCQFVRSGWLVRIATGVYRFAHATPTLYGALASVQQQVGLDYRIAATAALNLQGFYHYVPMGKPQVQIAGKLPRWLTEHPWAEELRPFRTSVIDGTQDVRTVDVDGITLRVSAPELAIMECILLSPAASLLDVYYMMQSLTTLRASVVSRLLARCTSVRVKRLFLYMAEKAGHSWYRRLNLDGVTLGSGPRSIARGGITVTKYNIVIPKELAEYE